MCRNFVGNKGPALKSDNFKLSNLKEWNFSIIIENSHCYTQKIVAYLNYCRKWK